MSPADQELLSYATSRGWLSPEQVSELQGWQAQLSQSGTPTSLGTLLGQRYLNSEQLSELKTHWLSISSSGELAPLPHGTLVPPPGSDSSRRVAAAASVGPASSSGLSSSSGAFDILGQTIGNYRVDRELARGGMGVVYIARDVRLDREVALKLMLSEHASPVLLERFRREAQGTAKLNHPNIVRVHHFGDVQGRPYYVMDLVAGESLKKRIQRDGPLDEREAAEITEKLARGLQHAHETGVLHRDMKPDNVLLAEGDGRPLITDFGLARDSAEQQRLTKTGEMLGTPAYMPPEQADGDVEGMGTHSDTYSVGATLYHMLTGRPPFEGDTPIHIIKQLLIEDPVPPQKRLRGLDPVLGTICMKALEKEAGDRYHSIGAMADDLVRWREGEPIQATPPTRGDRLRKWARRRRGRLLGMTVTVGGLVIGLGVFVGGSLQQKWASDERLRTAEGEAGRERETRRAAERKAKAREADRVDRTQERDARIAEARAHLSRATVALKDEKPPEDMELLAELDLSEKKSSRADRILTRWSLLESGVALCQRAVEVVEKEDAALARDWPELRDPLRAVAAEVYLRRGSLSYDLADLLHDQRKEDRRVVIHAKRRGLEESVVTPEMAGEGLREDRDQLLDSALADMEKTLAIEPDTAEAYFVRGMVHRRNGLTRSFGGPRSKLDEYDKALADLTRYVEAAPRDERGYHYRGQLYRERVDEWENLGDEQAQAKEAELSKADIDRWFQLAEDPYEAREELGKLYRHRGDWGEAVALYTDLLENHPRPDRVAGLLEKRGDAYRKMGRPEDALRDYTQLVEFAKLIQKVSEGGHLARGKLYLELGRYEEALADADLLRERWYRPPRDVVPNVRWIEFSAQVRLEMGMLGKGEAFKDVSAFRWVCKNSPKMRGDAKWNARANKLLGQALSRSKNPDDLQRAEESLLAALSYRRNDTEVINALAIVLMKQGRFKKAQARVADGLKIAPDDPGLLVTRARIRDRTGDRKGARADFTRVLELEPIHKWAEVAKRGLARLGQ